MNPSRDAFVPLTAAAKPGKPNGDAKVTVIPQAANLQPFRPLGQGTPAPASAPAHNGSCEPRVNVQREGDRVTNIQVHCSCGQVIELACVY
jgi:hypothetical protein